MAKQEQVKRVGTKDAEELAEQDAARQQDTERGRRAAKVAEREDKLEDIDDLLDEIDGLLEENASEVLARYVQKGGQ